MSSKEFKFQPEHLPIGTVVQMKAEYSRICLSSQEVDHSQPVQYTITGIVRNGYRSYVFTTGKTQKIGNTVVDVGSNLSWIGRIVKRGDGPIYVQDFRGYGVDRNSRAFTMLVKDRELFDVPADAFYANVGKKLGRKEGATLEPTAEVTYLLWQIADRGSQVNARRLTVAALAHGVIRRTDALRPFPIDIHVFSKRKLKDYIKRNWRRYLLNLNAEEKAQAAFEEREWDKMWEEERARDLADMKAEGRLDDDLPDDGTDDDRVEFIDIEAEAWNRERQFEQNAKDWELGFNDAQDRSI